MGLAAIAIDQQGRRLEDVAATGVVQGVVQSIRCWMPASSFCVCSIIPDDFPNEQLTVKGVLPEPATGACYRFEGKLADDPKWGRQFAAKSMTEILPSEIRGIERYLAYGPFPHIGPSTAKKMVDRWGVDTLRMLDSADAAQLLDEVHGITPARATRILEEWREQREKSGLYTGLNRFGLTQWQIRKLVAQYGARAVSVLEEDPYQVIGEIPRFGFLTVDSIAGRVGIPRNDIRRSRAAVIHLLESASEEGHCYLPLGSGDSKEGLLGQESQDAVKLQQEHLAAGLAVLQRRTGSDGLGVVHIEYDHSEPGGARVYLRALFDAERRAAEAVRTLASTPLPPWDEFEMEAADGAALESISLTEQQRLAVEVAKTSRMLVVTGGPGTGKTTVLKNILEAWKLHRTSPGLHCPLHVELAAPTGKAAQRMSDATGCKARTIHRLLEWSQGGFTRDEEEPLEADAVVIDEVSMVDLPLFDSLLQAINPAKTRLILVGDVDQLPSVGPGQVLHDVIASGVCPVVRLTQIMRQEADSQIIQAAHAINAGTFRGNQVDNDRGDLYWIEHDRDCAPDVVSEDLVRMVTVDMPASGWDPIRGVQVLCPQKRGPTGTEWLNQRLQAILNPPADGKPELVIGKRRKRPARGRADVGTGPDDDTAADGGRILRLGDKVIQTRNNYKLMVFNGEVGFIVGIDLAKRQVCVDFGDGDGGSDDAEQARVVPFESEDLFDLQTAYALTVHKSQGSEFPCVVIPLHTTHYMMLRRRLLYTGVTRARECCVLVGTDRALKQAVRCNEESKRFTRLAELLREGENG